MRKIKENILSKTTRECSKIGLKTADIKTEHEERKAVGNEAWAINNKIVFYF